MSQDASDVSAQIAQLFVYPVKSCAGVALTECVLTETGLEFDRAWMVVDEHGVFVSQRELPRMALIRPQLKFHEMVLRAPGMLALHVALDQVEQACRVRVWDDEVAAYDMGAVAAQWFSDFLGQPLRLVRFDPEHERVSSPKWTGATKALNQFADGFAVLVASQASLDELNQRLQADGHAAVGIERFRPNLVLSGVEAHDEDRIGRLRVDSADASIEMQMVKPCSRCPIPDIDPATADSSPEVGDMLRRYRSNPVVNGAITFGMNAIVLQGIDQVLRVGQPVSADFRFD